MERITGTLIWYYYICKREVWLMAHELNPQQENPLIELGRLIHEDSYEREKKGFETTGMKIDIVKFEGKEIIIGEVKKTSRFLKSATMQLLYYLFRLKENGIISTGELLIPKEKKRIKIELSLEKEIELKNTFEKINEIIRLDRPPEPKRINFCKNCAYYEFCWI